MLATFMTTEYATITAHLVAALLVGGVIGLERSFHGRPAGFRTHTLVCVASSLLMLVTLYQWQWLPGIPLETVEQMRAALGPDSKSSIIVYPGAPHGFNADYRESYVEADAKDGWAKMLAFFAANGVA